MPIYHYEFEQKSAAWYQTRLGIPTASEMDRIITPTGKPAKGERRQAYMNRLLAEWILGRPIEQDVDSLWMERGNELEQSAVEAFQFQTGLGTKEVGFVTTDDGMAGCSPDRLVGDTGTLEIKCPAPNTHVGYMRGATVADDYRVQNQAQMMICERETSWVVSYHPQLPRIVIEVPRDVDFQALLSASLRDFIAELITERQSIESRYGPFVRPSFETKKESKPGHWDFDVTEEDLNFILSHRGSA